MLNSIFGASALANATKKQFTVFICTDLRFCVLRLTKQPLENSFINCDIAQFILLA
jgi:hypothetical protein